MFDWDRDYEDVVHHKTIKVHKETEAETIGKPWYWQSLASRIVLPLVAAVGIMVAAFMGNQSIGSATATTTISAAIFGGATRAAEPAITMPDTLQAYDQAAFDRFMTRMAGISDSDLVQYSHATQRDLGDGTGVMAPYHSDVLTLTRLEMTRRGLVQQTQRLTQAAAPVAVAENDNRAAALILQATAPLIVQD